MISIPYFRQIAKTNVKFLGAFTLVLCIFLTVMTNVSKEVGLPTKAERMRVSGYHRVKTLEELLTTQVKGTKAANGTTISRVSQHIVEQARKRSIEPLLTEATLKKTLKNPLDIGKIRIDKKGKSSQRLTGEELTICVNNKDGTLITVWKTNTKKAKKLKKGK